VLITVESSSFSVPGLFSYFPRFVITCYFFTLLFLSMCHPCGFGLTSFHYLFLIILLPVLLYLLLYLVFLPSFNLFVLFVAVWLTGKMLVSTTSYSTSDPVSTWMGDRLHTGKPSLYVTSHPGQLSLAIPPWVGTMSTSKSWGVNGARYTSPVSVVSQCKLVSD